MYASDLTEVRYTGNKDRRCRGPPHGQRGVIVGRQGHQPNEHKLALMYFVQFDDGQVWFCWPDEIKPVQRPRVYHEPDWQRLHVIKRQRSLPHLQLFNTRPI